MFIVLLQLILCVALLLTAVIGKGAVCFLVVRFKELKTVPNILLANLACVEVLNNLVNVPLYMVHDIGNKKSLITSTVAWWLTFLAILFGLLSLASMFILVADRYFAIVYTMKYYVWKSPRKALVAAMTAWISALVAAVLGSAVMLYNVELGEKSPFYYRTTYVKKKNHNLLLAECEVRTVSYGLSFLLPFMAQARSARAMKTRKEKTRIHNLPYGLSKRG